MAINLPPGGVSGVDLPPVTDAVGRLIDFLWDRFVARLQRAGVTIDGLRANALQDQMTVRTAVTVVTTISPPRVANPATPTVEAGEAMTLEGVWVRWSGPTPCPGFTARLWMDSRYAATDGNGVLQSLTTADLVIGAVDQEQAYLHLPATSLVTREIPRGTEFWGQVVSISSNPYASQLGNCIRFEAVGYSPIRLPRQAG